MMKTCTKCGETKPKNEFYRDRSKQDGKMSNCKACHRKYTLSPAGRKSQKKYHQTKRFRKKQRRAGKRYRQSEHGREVRAEYQVRYRQTKEGLEADARYYETHKLERLARSTTNNAIRAGRLPSPRNLLCQCGKKASEYHHTNYAIPLDVTALCKSCHLEEHASVEVPEYPA